MPSNQPAVELIGLTASYGKRKPALEDVNLVISPGDLVAVVGPNGAGKTTLFKSMLGLIAPTRGEARLFGAAPRLARRRVAYVAQRDAVDWQFPLTAADVVMMGRIHHSRWRVRPSESDRRATTEALARVGLTAAMDAPIGTLSGGQQQRVMIARALAQDAALLLMDEPFNEVDTAAREQLLGLLTTMCAEGRSAVVAMHDLNLARERFPITLFLNRRVIAYGPSREVFNPTTLRQTYIDQEVNWEAAVPPVHT